MWDLIKRFGIGGALGAIVGMALVIWLDPTTSEGQALVLVVGVLATVLVVEVAHLICRRSRERVPQEDE